MAFVTFTLEITKPFIKNPYKVGKNRYIDMKVSKNIL